MKRCIGLMMIMMMVLFASIGCERKTTEEQAGQKTGQTGQPTDQTGKTTEKPAEGAQGTGR